MFHARPVKHTPSAGGAPVRDDEDFYAAKAREGDNAEVVEETNDTQVELPIDQVEAEVVEVCFPHPGTPILYPHPGTRILYQGFISL